MTDTTAAAKVDLIDIDAELASIPECDHEHARYVFERENAIRSGTDFDGDRARELAEASVQARAEWDAERDAEGSESPAPASSPPAAKAPVTGASALATAPGSAPVATPATEEAPHSVL
jgi:hypothetical protein